MGPDEYYGYQNQQPAYTPQDDPAAKRKRLIIGIGGMFGFFVILIIIISMLLSSPTIRPDISKIAAQQNEIARVASLGVSSEDARRATQNTAANVRAVSLSSIGQIQVWGNANLANPLKAADLDDELNEEFDVALDEAGAVNEYDEVFTEAMVNLLEGSNRQIVASFDVFSAYPDLQDILNRIGENNQSLIDAISSQ